MARNKYPEQTVSKILDVSLKLFVEKGFDQTSIQDIIDNLGGLTKGAVYHHFSSKEEILKAAIERDNKRLYEEIRAICEDANMTGAQKFQTLLEASIAGPQFDIWADITPEADPIKNSRLLGFQYQAVFSEIVPLYVEPIIREGVQDGSIVTSHPQELAEVLVLLANLWVSPMFRRYTPEKLLSTAEYYLEVVEALGVKIVDVSIGATLENYRMTYSEHAVALAQGKESG